MTDNAVQLGRPATRRRRAIGPVAFVLSLMPYAVFLVLVFLIHPTWGSLTGVLGGLLALVSACLGLVLGVVGIVLGEQRRWAIAATAIAALWFLYYSVILLKLF